MLQMLAEMEPRLFAPDAVEHWADLAAQSPSESAS